MSTLSERLEQLRGEAEAGLASAGDADAVEALRIALLGRNGSLTGLMRELGSVPADERPAIGQVANRVRQEVEGAIADRLEQLHRSAQEERLVAEALDMSALATSTPS
jgi:phenylalanyl-tRNA synthetase alpha chain